MIENMLINKCEIFEKQIVNNGGIRQEQLISKGIWKGRLSGFYSSGDTERLGVQKIVEDKRKLYLEKKANVKKGDVVKIDGVEQYEVINIYKVQDGVGIKFLTCLVKNIG